MSEDKLEEVLSAVGGIREELSKMLFSVFVLYENTRIHIIIGVLFQILFKVT